MIGKVLLSLVIVYLVYGIINSFHMIWTLKYDKKFEERLTRNELFQMDMLMFMISSKPMLCVAVLLLILIMPAKYVIYRIRGDIK